VLPLIGGIFIDRLGNRKGVFLFSFILIIGQGVCTIGVGAKSYGVILIGRIIFGLGGENLAVTQSAIVAKWFKGKELAFALGLNITISRLGSVIASWTSLPLYNINNSLWIPLFVATCFCSLSWVTGIFLNFMDAQADRMEGVIEKHKQSHADKVNLEDIKKMSLLYWLLNVSCLMNYVAILPFMSNITKML